MLVQERARRNEIESEEDRLCPAQQQAKRTRMLTLSTRRTPGTGSAGASLSLRPTTRWNNAMCRDRRRLLLRGRCDDATRQVGAMISRLLGCERANVGRVERRMKSRTNLEKLTAASKTSEASRLLQLPWHASLALVMRFDVPARAPPPADLPWLALACAFRELRRGTGQTGDRQDMH